MIIMLDRDAKEIPSSNAAAEQRGIQRYPAIDRDQLNASTGTSTTRLEPFTVFGITNWVSTSTESEKSRTGWRRLFDSQQ